MKKEILQNFIRSEGFAWPGGYPCALLMDDGEVIDSKAARENYKLIRREVDRKWKPLQVFIHWEGEPLFCAHSGRQIESAYGVIEEDLIHE